MTIFSATMRALYTVSRYVIALLVLFYGFAKINGAQFTVLDSVLDKPMREVSGFWLTWYYYGYSAVYGTFIALVQIGGAILLLFRRTTLLGACLLFGVITNILLVDIFYDIALGALFMAAVIEVGLLFILWHHRAELVALFWTTQNKMYPVAPGRKKTTTPRAAHVIRGLIIVLPALLTYLIATFNNRHPTPLDGRWDVVQASGQAAAQVPERVYFEYNRAFMCVFKYPDAWATHHFEVDDEAGTLSIWERYMSKGDTLFTGTYEAVDDGLVLRGTFQAQPVQMRLERLE